MFVVVCVYIYQQNTGQRYEKTIAAVNKFVMIAQLLSFIIYS